MFLLDTVVLSELRKNECNPNLIRWIAGQNDTKLFISVVTIGEIERGINLQKSKNTLFASKLTDWLAQLILLYDERILPVSTQIAKKWGELSARLGNNSADLLIAATALVPCNV